KTSFAVLLARSLAMLGRRTLLVEADLRRPSLAERLNLDTESGLAALLMGSTADESVIVRSSVDKLDILAAGELPENFSAELLANGVLSRCLERWKEKYDFVLLDSPPVLPVADARILSSQADGTILVLRSSHCRRAEVAQACTDLTDAGGRLVGAVLVGVPIGSVYGGYGAYETTSPTALGHVSWKRSEPRAGTVT
ncbi:MAG: CpsD/CapB family tyrosine-protein kinase, partial [Planctomycetes bacterium]|nr:CpsD/CapB family tyrosine-protein kinase [Planctomycetota bacterium]